jgi:hypothetical protein
VGSKVFTHKNPWLRAILSILNSISNIPGIRNNIIFEIRDLFKKLNINDENNELINNHFFEGKIPNKNSNDFNNNNINQNQIIFSNNNPNPQINPNNVNYPHHQTPQNENANKPSNKNITLKDEKQLNLIKQQLWNEIIRSNYLPELIKIFENEKVFDQQIIDKNQ